VNDARARGAVAVAGGKPLDRRGYFFAPTILTGLSDGTRIVDEEQFGPVLPVVSYRDLDDAIDRANTSNYGLTASVWSPDLERTSSVAARLDYGQVSLNAHGGAVRPTFPSVATSGRPRRRERPVGTARLHRPASPRPAR